MNWQRRVALIVTWVCVFILAFLIGWALTGPPALHEVREDHGGIVGPG